MTVITTGETLIFGSAERYSDRDPLQATLIVRDEAFWLRLVLFGDLGFAEGFMEGQSTLLYPSSYHRLQLTLHTYFSRLLGHVIIATSKLSAHLAGGSVWYELEADRSCQQILPRWIRTYYDACVISRAKTNGEDVLGRPRHIPCQHIFSL